MLHGRPRLVLIPHRVSVLIPKMLITHRCEYIPRLNVIRVISLLMLTALVGTKNRHVATSVYANENRGRGVLPPRTIV
jgi:hypothetical protein